MIRPFLTSVAAAFAFSFRRFAVARLRPSMQVIDGIAAIVNGDVITYSQVRGLVGAARENAARAISTAKNWSNKFRKRARRR